MKRIQWVARRLDGWQRWCFECGKVRSTSGQTDERVSYSPKPRDLMSAVDFEAIEIEMAVWELEFDLKAAVMAYYLWPEKASMEFLSGRLGITRKCFHERLCRADIFIARWIEDHQIDKYVL